MSTESKPFEYTSPYIRQLERNLEAAETAQASQRSTSNEKIVGLASVHNHYSNATLIVAGTRNGALYSIDLSEEEPDWKSLPPVPGTNDRVLYDAVEGIRRKIAECKAALGNPDAVNDG